MKDKQSKPSIDVPADDVAGPLMGWVDPQAMPSAEDRVTMDVDETDDQMTVTLGLPGFDRDSVEVTTHGAVLAIHAADSLDPEDSVSRTLMLSAAVRVEDIWAHLDGSVLTVMLPKRPSKSRVVPVERN